LKAPYEVEFSIKQLRMRGFTYKWRHICIKQHEPLISQGKLSAFPFGPQAPPLVLLCTNNNIFPPLQNTNTHKFQEISMHPTQDHTP
jgi:hypothetical protein